MLRRGRKLGRYRDDYNSIKIRTRSKILGIRDKIRLQQLREQETRLGKRYKICTRLKSGNQKERTPKASSWEMSCISMWYSNASTRHQGVKAL